MTYKIYTLFVIYNVFNTWDIVILTQTVINSNFKNNFCFYTLYTKPWYFENLDINIDLD